ncbi:fluoride exporter, partial [Phenoliferia sp. Uapishka_3]
MSANGAARKGSTFEEPSREDQVWSDQEKAAHSAPRRQRPKGDTGDDQTAPGDDDPEDAEEQEEAELDEPSGERDLGEEDDREAARLGLSLSGSRSKHRSTTPSSKLRETRDARLLKAATYSLLTFATFWGVLARLGLEWIGKFADGQVFALIWPQIGGCVVMGFVTDRKRGIEKSYVPLFVALGTGFCGSLTTFSSWMYETFEAFANLESGLNSRFRGFLSGVAILIITLAASNSALRIGVQLSTFLPRRKSLQYHTKHSPRKSSTLLQDHAFAILLGPLFYIGAILLLILGPHSWRSRATFATVLGPPGTILRYELSRIFNAHNPRFPLGTLTANSFAVLIFAITAILQRRANSALGCAALKGVQDGFCGSLSTVSTFVVELRNLGTRDSWRYAGGSWVVGQCLLVLLLGSWVWSGNREFTC